MGKTNYTKITCYEKEIADMKKQLKTQTETMDVMREEKRTIEEKLESLEESRNASKNVDALIKQLNQSLNQNQDYVREINKYKTELGMKDEYENETDSLKSEIREKEKTIEKLQKELKKTKEQRQSALDELLAKDLAAEVPVVRRSNRKSRATKSATKAKQEQQQQDSHSTTPKLFGGEDKENITITSTTSSRCSPLHLDMESTRCDYVPDPSSRALSNLTTTINLTSTEDLTTATTTDLTAAATTTDLKAATATASDNTLKTPAPTSKKKKKLLRKNTSVFEASPDGVDRTTGNETGILEATMPLEIGGKRMTRSSRVRK